MNRRAGAGLALSYLFHGGQLPTFALVEAARTLRQVELDDAERDGRDPDEAHQLWLPPYPSPSAHWLSLDEDFADQEEAEGRDRLYAPPPVPRDPMYALLEQLGRDGRAGRALFTDAAIASYVFGERDVLGDGGRRVTAAAAAAAAGPDVVPTAPADLLEDAALVASAFVNHFGTAHGDDAMHRTPDAVARSVAEILGHHVPSVHQALITRASVDPPVGSVAPYKYLPFGDDAAGVRARFDRRRAGRRHRPRDQP